MLTRKNERQARRSPLAATLANQSGGVVDRRSFLRRSGLVAGGLSVLGALPLTGVRKAQAAGSAPAAGTPAAASTPASS